jgi:hypothetical protein
MHLLKKDNFFLGMAMALLLPLPLYGIFYGLDILMKGTGLWHGLQHPENIYLLSTVGNLLLVRLTFVSWRNQKTGKGVLLTTIALVLAFFYLFFQQPR